ncbi:MAG: iron ABC transporter substrate-binding protein [Chloroflexi bacterium]|nr:iron ABC transporter substrate-binding protein [Chloroflexota bacterium]
MLVLASAACGGDEESLTVYSGRSAELIGPLIERFTEETGIQVDARYAGTAELAALLVEEGDRSPADVFIAQDAGALGAVQAAGLLARLDDDLLARLDPAFRSREGKWVGLSGRVRVVVYNTEAVDPAELPESILDFVDPRWRGRIGWAPQNGSFQAWVTALRATQGEDAARAWLEAVRANGAVEYPNNTSIVQAAASGEIEVGFVNHYYLHRFLAEEGDGFGARNHYTAPGDAGTLVNVAGAGILASSRNEAAAQRLLEFLLGEAAQRYYAEETFEYPLLPGVPSTADLPTIAELQPLDVDLSRLDDLDGTLRLLREVGVLP